MLPGRGSGTNVGVLIFSEHREEGIAKECRNMFNICFMSGSFRLDYYVLGEVGVDYFRLFGFSWSRLVVVGLRQCQYGFCCVASVATWVYEGVPRGPEGNEEGS